MKNSKVLGLVLLALLIYSTAALGDLIDDAEEDAAPIIKEESESDKISKEKKEIKNQSNEGKSKKSRKKIRRKSQKNEPIHINSDGDSSYSRNSRIMTLRKNVLITKGDIRFQSDRAKIFQGEEEKIEKVEVNGNVRMSRFSSDEEQNISARSKKAIYDNKKGTVVLTGNPRIWRGGNLITGKVITYEIDTEIIRVKKAQGMMNPEEFQDGTK